MNILQIENLQKSFHNQKVLNGFNMNVPEHSIFGFVGQNGAGKTTTMKIVLGLLQANGGEVQVCGERVQYGETKTNRHIGFLPDVPEFYSYMTAQEYLKLCGDITGLDSKKAKLKTEELLHLVGLESGKRKIKGFSRGMKQRLGFAQALLNEPKLLICDEPTSALDPIGRKEILDILRSIKGVTTVVFSTHILSDVERVCDRVALLHKGKLALSGTLQEIKGHYNHNGFVIEFETLEQAKLFAGQGIFTKPFVSCSAQERTVTVTINDPKENGNFLLPLLTSLNILPLKFEKLEPTLENLFVEVVQ